MEFSSSLFSHKGYLKAMPRDQSISMCLSRIHFSSISSFCFFFRWIALPCVTLSPCLVHTHPLQQLPAAIGTLARNHHSFIESINAYWYPKILHCPLQPSGSVTPTRAQQLFPSLLLSPFAVSDVKNLSIISTF